MKDKLSQLFATIDSKNADSFSTFLTEDACFRFANSEVIRGKGEIRNAVTHFFSSLKGLRHSISSTWHQDDIIICEGEVTYTRFDDSRLAVPFVDIFRVKNGFIADYRIYIDISLLGGKK